MSHRGYDRKPPTPMKGRGYFNKGTGISAGLAGALGEARKPYTSVDAEGRTNVDITKDSYHEDMVSAQKKYSEYPETAGDSNPVWTMPYKQREALVFDAQVTECYDEDAFDGLCAQADMFGMESLKEQEQHLVNGGREQWFNTVAYMDGIGSFDDGHDDIRDTGRYVVLRSPDGSETSQVLMELEPRMDVHRFLDLEAPEGQAQILEFKEGAYTVESEVGDCQLVRDGIQAARAYKAERGYIFSHEGGEGELHASRSDLKTQFKDEPATDRVQLSANGMEQAVETAGKELSADSEEKAVEITDPELSADRVAEAITGAEYAGMRVSEPVTTAAMDALNARVAHDDEERVSEEPTENGRSVDEDL